MAQLTDSDTNLSFCAFSLLVQCLIDDPLNATAGQTVTLSENSTGLSLSQWPGQPASGLGSMRMQ